MRDRLIHTGYTREEAVAALRSEGLELLEWTDAPGARYAEHRHPHREVRVVLGGELTITCGGIDHRLLPGDRFDLEPDEPHSARVGPAGVRYLAGTDEST